MTEPVVSIIIPVYNTSQYLDQCLDSLVNQTLHDIEIICVNDASTDNSLEVLHLWAEKDSRIKVIDSLENRRQGGARNIGIKAASGSYIGFVDSDDYVSTEFYESLVASSNHGADVITANRYKQFGMVEKTVSQFDDNMDLKDQQEIKRRIAVNSCRLWMSIFKRSYLTNNQLFFPEKVVYEDNAIGICMFLLANCIEVVNNISPLYFYRVNPTSVVHGEFTERKFSDRLLTAKMMLHNMEKYGLMEKYKEEFDYWFYRTFYHNTLSLLIFRTKSYSSDSVRRVYREYKSLVGNFPCNKFIKGVRNYSLYRMIGKYPQTGRALRRIKEAYKLTRVFFPRS